MIHSHLSRLQGRHLWILPFLSLLLTSSQAATIFSQDFTSSTNVNDYVGADTASQFQALEQGGAGTTMSTAIASDALEWTNITDGPGATPQSGWALTADYNEMALFSAQISLTFGSSSFTNGNDVALFQIGSYASTTGGAGLPTGTTRNSLGFRYISGTDVTVNLNGDLVDTQSIAFDTATTFTLYGNANGGDGLMYLGPDGLTHTLDEDRISVFIGTTLFKDNVAVGNAARDIDEFRMGYNTRLGGGNIDGGTLSLNSLVINNDLNIVPEPTSIALLTGSFGLLLLRRRGR